MLHIHLTNCTFYQSTKESKIFFVVTIVSVSWFSLLCTSLNKCLIWSLSEHCAGIENSLYSTSPNVVFAFKNLSQDPSMAKKNLRLVFEHFLNLFGKVFSAKPEESSLVMSLLYHNKSHLFCNRLPQRNLPSIHQSLSSLTFLIIASLVTVLSTTFDLIWIYWASLRIDQVKLWQTFNKLLSNL